MTSEERGFLILLIVNGIIAALYLLWNLVLKAADKKDRRKSFVLKTMVMLLCPGVGVGFMAFGYVCHKLVFYRPVDLEDVIFSKDRVKPQMAAEEESESNLVPVEEAVAVADKGSLRNMMLHVVKGNVGASLSAISMALDSDDSEASHYAAAALQNVLNEFQTSVQKNYAIIMVSDEKETGEEREKRLRLSEETVDTMAELMRQRLLTESEQKEYARRMDEICEKLFQEEAERMTAERMEAASLQQLEARDYEACRKWCLRAYTAYPEKLQGYVCQLKLYFMTREKEKFFRILEELRSSGMDIDKETLELVRVFL